MTPAADDLRRTAFVGSGNLLADKRYAFAEALLAEGDLLAAADLFAQAAEEAPDWAPPYLARGLALEQAGAVADARAAFRQAAKRDSDGRLGAALHVARLEGATPATMPAAYVATLFDQYAPRFEAHLTGPLSYRGPAVIRDALDDAAPGRRFGATLDLGCGTGLMARALAGLSDPIDGIDLSSGMVVQAETTGLYRTLRVGDCVAVTRALAGGGYDLVVAADVLVYLGDLSPILEAVAAALLPGGLFAATLQTGPSGVTLGPDLRYRHGPDHLQAALAAAGFAPPAVTACVTRREAGQDVPGLVFVARRP